MTKSTDEGGHTTVFAYNADSRLIKQTDAEGKVINYEYDTQGRLERTIDGSGNVTAMEYAGASASGCSRGNWGRVLISASPIARQIRNVRNVNPSPISSVVITTAPPLQHTGMIRRAGS